MNYAAWINAVTALLEYQVVDATSATPTAVDAFNTSIPAAIDYTENRLQRDLNLLATNITSTGAVTPNNRTVTLPTASGTYIVCSQIRLVVGGVRQSPLEPVTRDYLDYAWPADSSPGAGILPVQWCPADQATIRIGPAPDLAYSFEAVGTMRLAQLSNTNTSNLLTLQFPDLYVAASMIYWAGFQSNYGAQSDNPQQAQSWENQYLMLLKGGAVEEARKQFANMFPSPSTPAGLTGPQ